LAVVQKTKTMKKDSAFKLKSGNKPSISKMMGVSPVKNKPSKLNEFGETQAQYEQRLINMGLMKKPEGHKTIKTLAQTKNEAVKAKIKEQEEKSKKKSVATKKKFRGARSAAAGQTAGQVIRRERLMI